MSSLESKQKLLSILEGKLPSDVLNSILMDDNSIDKYDLADMFLEEFNMLDNRVLSLIWNWKSIKSFRGIDDKQFNDLILNEMKVFGYDFRRASK